MKQEVKILYYTKLNKIVHKIKQFVVKLVHLQYLKKLNTAVRKEKIEN